MNRLEYVYCDMTFENQNNDSMGNNLFCGNRSQRTMTAGFHGNRHEHNNNGTAGNGVFYWVSAEAT
jgi:hypothetical protein